MIRLSSRPEFQCQDEPVHGFRKDRQGGVDVRPCAYSIHVKPNCFRSQPRDPATFLEADGLVKVIVYGLPAARGRFDQGRWPQVSWQRDCDRTALRIELREMFTGLMRALDPASFRAVGCSQMCRAVASGDPARLLYRYVSAMRRWHGAADRGFSLLELVVVVAILGVLTAVSLPALMGNTERARIVAAKAAIQNAVSECAVAKQEGASQADLTFRSAGGNLTADLIPSLFANPDGYRFDDTRGGCHAMYLVPTETTGPGPSGSGYPILQAKLAARGRIVKAFQYCQATSSVDLTADCASWDSQGAVAQAENCSDSTMYPNSRQRQLCRQRNADRAGTFSSNRNGLNDPGHPNWNVVGQ